MEKGFFILLGLLWAAESFVVLAIIQPILTRRIGEIATLTLSFASLFVFYALFSLLTPGTWTLSCWVAVKGSNVDHVSHS